MKNCSIQKRMTNSKPNSKGGMGVNKEYFLLEIIYIKF